MKALAILALLATPLFSQDLTPLVREAHASTEQHYARFKKEIRRDTLEKITNAKVRKFVADSIALGPNATIEQVKELMAKDVINPRDLVVTMSESAFNLSMAIHDDTERNLAMQLGLDPDRLKHTESSSKYSHVWPRLMATAFNQACQDAHAAAINPPPAQRGFSFKKSPRLTLADNICKKLKADLVVALDEPNGYLSNTYHHVQRHKLFQLDLVQDFVNGKHKVRWR